MTDNENQCQEYDYFNDINNIPEDALDKPNYYADNEQIDQNNFENNLLNGVNSNLNTLLSNLKNNEPKDMIKYSTINTSLKTPSKQNSDDFPNLSLVEAFNKIVESNTNRNYNYISPVRSQKQINMRVRANSKTNNNSLFSNPKIKTSDNALFTNNDFINNDNNNNSFLSYQINYNHKNNYSNILNKSNNTQRNINSYNKFKRPNSNKLKGNKRQLSYNLNNINISSYSQTNQLFDIINQLRTCNNDNRNDILNIKQEYNKMQNILFSEIKKFLYNNSNDKNQRQKDMNFNKKLKQVNDIKNKLLSDINILSKEKNSILNEIKN